MIIFYFYIIFIIPIIFHFNCWLIYQFIIMVSLFIYSLISINIYFSNIRYIFGIDLYSYRLIVLTLLISSLIIITRFIVNKINRKSLFLLINLILCICLVSIFSIINILLIYLFFEFRLLPLIIIIFGWGYQPERLIAGLYLFFYTLFASLPLLLVIIYLYFYCNTIFFNLCYNNYTRFFVHFFIVFAFLVKLPMFIVHFWLPKAHVQAPVSGSMILAGLLLKIGGYGLIRFVFINELMFIKYGFVWYSFGLVGSILVRLICLIQGDVKCLIAYSSIAHINTCLLGILTITKWGLVGSFLIIIAHGLCSSGLFCMANIYYERVLRRRFFINKGLLTFIPRISLIIFILCFFNIRCPPRISFLRETIIINRIIRFYLYSSFYILIISLLSACFRFYLFSFTQHGSPYWIYSYSYSNVRENLLISIHIYPILIILLIVDLVL